MTFFNGKLYFNTYYGDIAISDGTAAGTEIISSLGMTKMFVNNKFVPYQGKLYYTNRRNELCVTDGTSSGTTMIVDIHPTDSSSLYGIRYIVGTTDAYLFFYGNDGTNGNQLYRTDGTPENTSLVISGSFWTEKIITSLCVFDNHLYFEQKLGSTGLRHLMRSSDGTDATKEMVDTLGDAIYLSFQVHNNELYFRCKGFSGPSTERDYIAKLTNGQVDSLTMHTTGHFILNSK